MRELAPHYTEAVTACGHRFCVQCLALYDVKHRERVANRRGRAAAGGRDAQEEEEEEEGSMKLPCPMCRTPIDLPPEVIIKVGMCNRLL